VLLTVDKPEKRRHPVPTSRTGQAFRCVRRFICRCHAYLEFIRVPAGGHEKTDDLSTIVHAVDCGRADALRIIDRCKASADDASARPLALRVCDAGVPEKRVMVFGFSPFASCAHGISGFGTGATPQMADAQGGRGGVGINDSLPWVVAEPPVMQVPVNVSRLR
jgi:hypothetical protein